MLANAVGTLLAAVVIYIYGVAAGLIAANWRVLVPILSIAPLAGIAWIIQHVKWNELPKGKRLRLVAIYLGPALVVTYISGYFAGYTHWPFALFVVLTVSPFVIALGYLEWRWSRRIAGARTAAAGGRPQGRP
jgi:uncharacterized membrane protein AbrB (regulator of aidB expression)